MKSSTLLENVTSKFGGNADACKSADLSHIFGAGKGGNVAPFNVKNSFIVYFFIPRRFFIDRLCFSLTSRSESVKGT